MRYQYALSWKKRAAFTLIELLVVIAIIGILASLLLAGVMMMLRKGPEINNRNDVLQIGIGLDKFKTKYGFYPPSKIKLCERYVDYNPSNTFDAQSLSYLRSMWPNLDSKPTATFAWAGVAPTTQVYILEGHQCLVFFLGGIPSGGNNKAPMGFSTDPNNPTNPSTALDRVKFFDFESIRCELLGGSPFPSYLDSHSRSTGKKTPFAYFSSYKRPNGYSPFGSSDNAALGVSPYMEAPTKFINPTTYQLISAGADGVFGPGGVWTPSGVAATGRDDIANFNSDRNLGVSP